MSEPRYWLKATAIPGSKWQEVSKKEWIAAERCAGFRPRISSDHPAYETTCATGGWSTSHGISGTITYGEFPPA